MGCCVLVSVCCHSHIFRLPNVAASSLSALKPLLSECLERAVRPHPLPLSALLTLKGQSVGVHLLWGQLLGTQHCWLRFSFTGGVPRCVLAPHFSVCTSPRLSFYRKRAEWYECSKPCTLCYRFSL